MLSTARNDGRNLPDSGRSDGQGRGVVGVSWLYHNMQPHHSCVVTGSWQRHAALNAHAPGLPRDDLDLHDHNAGLPRDDVDLHDHDVGLPRR